MAYWVAVCQGDTNPGVVAAGPGRGSVACSNPDGTSSAVAMEAQLMLVPPAGSTLFNLSAEDGALISTGLISVWVAAWGIRQVIRVIRGSGEDDS